MYVICILHNLKSDNHCNVDKEVDHVTIEKRSEMIVSIIFCNNKFFHFLLLRLNFTESDQ